MSVKAKLQERFGESLKFQETLDRLPTYQVPTDKLLEVAQFAKESLGMDMLVDLCGVDHPEDKERFEVVVHLLNTQSLERLRFKIRAPQENPKVPSLYPIWKGADWFEREAYDMFGITFEGHPDLRRILTGDYFKGHPLRKDYPADKRWRCTSEDLKRSIETPESDDFETVVLNMGPTHPATHGTFRIIVRLDGEKILWADTEIGYLHRCFEKMSETHTYQQVIPYTDRLNYCSSILNNVGYARAVEQMLGIEVPPRAQVIRVILGEFSRIIDHAVCLGTNLVDLGALTNYWYFYQIREEVYTLIEKTCGARLTTSYTRIGGLAKDVEEDFVLMCQQLLQRIPTFLADVEKLVNKNRIFQDRTMGVGAMTPEEAIAWGWTGPVLRACGVPYDVRKAYPYYDYDQYDWDVPIGSHGDTYDRYLVRMEEIRQSLKIIEQALKRLEPGSIMVDDPRVHLPDKDEVYNTMEGLIYHFEKVMFGLKPPKGEFYSFTEGANGELGFYIVSDGSPHPYRIKVRPPCFAIYQAFRHMLQGHMVPDVVAILGSLNIIAGELDR